MDTENRYAQSPETWPKQLRPGPPTSLTDSNARALSNYSARLNHYGIGWLVRAINHALTPSASDEMRPTAQTGKVASM